MTTSTKRIAYGLTAVWLLWWGWVFFGNPENLATPLNELGDFLAGVTAPLAFGWLVLGYFQHGQELRQNTEALKAQQEELNRQAAATESLAHIATSDQQQARRAAQPALIFDGSSSGAGQRQTSMDVRNIGGVAHNPRLGKSLPNGFQLLSSFPQRWESKHSVTFLYDTPKGEDYFPFRFSVQYTDSFSDKYEVVYEIRSLTDLHQVGEPQRSLDPDFFC